MTNSLGVAEDFGPERGQPPGFHVGPIRACDRFYLWEPLNGGVWVYLFIWWLDILPPNELLSNTMK